jgi:diguanylate cyclase (GGDEF)-like protein
VKQDQRGSLDRPPEELVGQPMSELLPPEPEALALATIKKTLETGELQVIEIEADVSGEGRRFEARMVPCGNDEVLVIARDVTEQRLTEERLAFQATHDALTELPNRILLNDRIEQALALSKRQGRRIALLFIDLDDFKTINDRYGHGMGDKVLVEVGRRLVTCVREADTVSRLGGDEFAVLIPDVTDASAPVRVAERIHKQMMHPIEIDGCSFDARVSVGIALSRSAKITPSELLRQADVAMYRAKRSGKGRYALYSQSQRVA